jgi:hypothetical protein
VYGVVSTDTELIGPFDGVDSTQPVTILREGALAAVTSEVPLEEFDEARLRENLGDMAWVEATARAHEAVLARICHQATVMPMRMCTVYRTDGGVREMLRRESGPLEEAIEHLGGKAEWGVKVFADLHRVSDGGEDAGDRDTVAGDTVAGASPGAAYMERKRPSANGASSPWTWSRRRRRGCTSV